MIKYLPFAIALWVSAFSHVANADTICIEFKEERTYLTNSKATWDGESLRIKFYNDTDWRIDDTIYLRYTTELTPKSKTIRNYDYYSTYAANQWHTIVFQLPSKPTSWRIFLTDDVCIKSREKTWLEKLNSL